MGFEPQVEEVLRRSLLLRRPINRRWLGGKLRFGLREDRWPGGGPDACLIDRGRRRRRHGGLGGAGLRCGLGVEPGLDEFKFLRSQRHLRRDLIGQGPQAGGLGVDGLAGGAMPALAARTRAVSRRLDEYVRRGPGFRSGRLSRSRRPWFGKKNWLVEWGWRFVARQGLHRGTVGKE
jgi:hypothetical protein